MSRFSFGAGGEWVNSLRCEHWMGGAIRDRTDIRVAFGREFVQRASDIHRSLGFALGHGDANEWHISGSTTDLVDLLISSYDLEYRKPQGAGHSHQWRRAGLCVHLQKLCSHHHCSQAISAVERRQLAAFLKGQTTFFALHVSAPRLACEV